jgi:hypothetical protein
MTLQQLKKAVDTLYENKPEYAQAQVCVLLPHQDKHQRQPVKDIFTTSYWCGNHNPANFDAVIVRVQ